MLRLATDDEGETLFPTEAEEERAARERAEAEIALLRAELASLRAKG